jgi:hypothetical protein
LEYRLRILAADRPAKISMFSSALSIPSSLSKILGCFLYKIAGNPTISYLAQAHPRMKLLKMLQRIVAHGLMNEMRMHPPKRKTQAALQGF